jgi:hypothetical protein
VVVWWRNEQRGERGMMLRKKARERRVSEGRRRGYGSINRLIDSVSLFRSVESEKERERERECVWRVCHAD